MAVVPSDRLNASSLLVGRERERIALSTYLDDALHDGGRIVLLSGEARIGKTALAHDLSREAETRGARVLVGRCYDRTETPPYGLWTDLFAHYWPGGGEPSPPWTDRMSGMNCYPPA